MSRSGTNHVSQEFSPRGHGHDQVSEAPQSHAAYSAQSTESSAPSPNPKALKPNSRKSTISENGGVEAALKYIDSVPFDVVVKARARCEELLWHLAACSGFRFWG